MRVHIIQRYDDTMKEKGEEEGERKERDIYIYNLQVAPSCLRCCFFETTRTTFMCSCILYMHISAYAHIHIQAHSLMRALILSCARTHARTRIHMHTTHRGARRHACTLAHVGPTMHAHTHPRMNTHACARTRANTPAHAHMRTRTHATHVHAVTCKHAPAQCTCMHTHAAHARMHPHNAQPTHVAGHRGHAPKRGCISAIFLLFLKVSTSESNPIDSNK